MRVLSVPITPFPNQRPGTSGLRKKVLGFRQPFYVEAFVQSVFDALPETSRGPQPPVRSIAARGCAMEAT